MLSTSANPLYYLLQLYSLIANKVQRNTYPIHHTIYEILCRKNGKNIFHISVVLFVKQNIFFDINSNSL